MKFLLLFLSVGFTSVLFGQTYTFSSFTGGYADLVGSTSLNNGQTWDDPSYTISIGFTFEYFGDPITTIDISDEGLGGVLGAGSCSFDPTISLLAAYGADIIDRGDDASVSLSNISHKTEGTTGNRVCKIEWNNVGFYSGTNDANGVRIDYMNFQVWLYETSNAIEIRFGPKSITEPFIDFDGETGTFVALIDNYDCNTGNVSGHQLMLGGTPASPDFYDDVYDINDTLLYLNGVIPPSTVYRFVPSATSSQDELSAIGSISIVPNPAEDFIRVVSDGNSEISKVSVIGMNGQVVMNVSNLNDQISVSELESGIYLIVIEMESGVSFSKKFTKN